MFERLLGSEWLPTIPDVHQRLRDGWSARVADVACGEGYSTLAIARAYPNVRVDGIDVDDASIAAANRHLAGSGLEDRVEFHRAEAARRRVRGHVRRSSTCTSRSTTCRTRSTFSALAGACWFQAARS
jgi:methylase of polypeptide subunit release factors